MTGWSKVILATALMTIALAPAAASAPEGHGTLTVDIGNVRVARGIVHVDVCPEATFLKEDCPWSGDAAARLGETRVSVRNLPAGRYAVQVFLDENGNRKVDRGLFGIPKEGIGFSNDARIRFGPPKFAEAAFTFDGTSKVIRLNLRYFTGPSGPPSR
ncbi:DUF2141 domain-containing protein [Sphingomonas sp. TX0543]|uniref:DUF2141 domain-containing protein n=1 Tax=Sphingomonas sp. TX0543 TaxID=3399682 RepID=UPI003AFA7CBA